jgi:hypothetical protein
LYSYEMRKRYLRSFEDAALCQTSMLDGWYDESEFTFTKREQFRRFLVDAHKAAYVRNITRMLFNDYFTNEAVSVFSLRRFRYALQVQTPKTS